MVSAPLFFHMGPKIATPSQNAVKKQHPVDPALNNKQNTATTTLNAAAFALNRCSAPLPSAVQVAIVGVGYVGETLVQAFGRVFDTIGYDINPKRIEQLRSLLSPGFPQIRLSSNEDDLGTATHYLIAVPTPLRADRSIDLDCITSAVHTVLRHARRGCTIVLESSVCVGTTRQLLGPFKDLLHCGMSPERVDPGRKLPLMADIPKVVSALSPASLEHIEQLYSAVFSQVVPVSKPEVAEFTKLYENCYRMINIAYVNEMSDACRVHGVDPHEMIEAASTKPYGFQAFHPGLGVGGHCIPINPFYLFANNKSLPVLERATREMSSRPVKLARKFHRRCVLNRSSSGTMAPRILVVGVGFKPGQANVSSSPGVSFAQTLAAIGCSRLAFYDPLVDAAAAPWMDKLGGEEWRAAYLDAHFDGIAVCTKQHRVDMGVLRLLQSAFVRDYT